MARRILHSRVLIESLMDLTRRPGPLLAALVLALGLGACRGGDERPGTPPDRLLLITVEGLRPDHLSACGYVRETTCIEGVDLEFLLDLDHLVTQGVSFANAFAPTGRLRPSLATLMTGRSPLEHRLLDEESALDPSLPTLAAGFSEAGFETGAAVCSPRDLTSSGLDRGFGHFVQVSDPREVLKAAVSMLNRWAETDSQFFLWVHFGGLGPPFEGEGFRDPFSAPEDGGYLAGVSSPAAWASGEVENNTRNRARLHDLYDGEVQRLAQLLGEFFVYYFERFERHFTSDHIATNLHRDTLFVVAVEGKLSPVVLAAVIEPLGWHRVHLDVVPWVVAASGACPAAGGSGEAALTAYLEELQAITGRDRGEMAALLGGNLGRL